MSDRALPEGVERFNPCLRTGVYRSLMEVQDDGEYFKVSDLPKLEAHVRKLLLAGLEDS